MFLVETKTINICIQITRYLQIQLNQFAWQFKLLLVVNEKYL